MPYSETIDKTVAAYRQLVGYEERLADSEGSLTADLMEQAVKDTAARLVELCAVREVADILSDRESLSRASEDLDQLEADGAVPADVIAERRGVIDALGEIGTRYLGISDVESPETTNNEDLVNEFFGRPARVVAEEVLGMKLKVNGRTAEITETIAQDGKYNERYLDDPIFGKDRVDVEILPSRGFYILYLRAGSKFRPNECVRIKGAIVNGKELTSAGKVTEALGIDHSYTASLSFDGDQTISIVRLTPYDRKS